MTLLARQRKDLVRPPLMKEDERGLVIELFAWLAQPVGGTHRGQPERFHDLGEPGQHASRYVRVELPARVPPLFSPSQREKPSSPALAFEGLARAAGQLGGFRHTDGISEELFADCPRLLGRVVERFKGLSGIERIVDLRQRVFALGLLQGLDRVDQALTECAPALGSDSRGRQGQ
jgi:hypothetical protein